MSERRLYSVIPIHDRLHVPPTAELDEHIIDQLERTTDLHERYQVLSYIDDALYHQTGTTIDETGDQLQLSLLSKLHHTDIGFFEQIDKLAYTVLNERADQPSVDMMIRLGTSYGDGKTFLPLGISQAIDQFSLKKYATFNNQNVIPMTRHQLLEDLIIKTYEPKKLPEIIEYIDHLAHMYGIELDDETCAALFEEWRVHHVWQALDNALI